MEKSGFLVPKGNFRNLIAFQKAECIYDVTYFFAHKFLERGDRTIDQMIQAARSGKQNIAEGNSSSMTSRESEIKLINVAKASFKELMLDYEDYLRTRHLEQWAMDSEKAIQARDVCAKQNDSAYYREAVTTRSDETIANIALILLHQEDYLLHRLLESIKQQFLEHGTMHEELIKGRRQHKRQQKK